MQTLSDVLPCDPFPSVIERFPLDAEQSDQFFDWNTSRVQLPQFYHLVVGENGTRMVIAAPHQTMPSSVLHVFSMGHILKIAHMVIGWIAVLMVHVWTFFSARPDKTTGNQGMHRKDSLPPVAASQSDRLILMAALVLTGGLKDSSRRSLANSSVCADVIQRRVYASFPLFTIEVVQ